MADTLQIVRWALEFTCPLRSAGAGSDPVRSLAAIGRAKVVSEYLCRPVEGGGIFGDVCVTSSTMERVPAGLMPANSNSAPLTNSSFVDRVLRAPDRQGREVCLFPSGGFLISKEFARIGGLDGLVATCRDCPANTERPRPAGCAGTLYLSPDSPDVERRLLATIRRLGLERDVADVFPRTNPLWYGFWVRSPLDPRASDLLGAILSEFVRQHSADREKYRPGPLDDDALLAFVRATKVAREHDLRLHVSMAPPGHTDFGYYTVFAHCPGCKAEADLERWRRRYPSTTYACKVCGGNYSPAATASSERDKYESSSLREALGTAQFERFAKDYLIARGLLPDRAERVLDAVRATEAERERIVAENRMKSEQRERFIRSVLYAGLSSTQLDPKQFGETPFFRADEFLKLLRRCKRYGVRVSFMFHESSDDRLCLTANNCGEEGELVFAEWRKDGCDEWFSASFIVPDSVLDE